jgi:feruloyl-CoA synthase
MSSFSTTAAGQRASIRPLRLGAYGAVTEGRADGSLLVRSAAALGPYPQRYTEALAHWAVQRPEAKFLAKRDAGGAWQSLSYGEAFRKVLVLGQALLDRGLSAERPLLILSGNDLEFALLALAALHVGIPVAPLSPAYSLLSADASKVRHAIERLTPGLVFAADGGAYGRAIRLAVPVETELVLTRGSVPGRPHVGFDALLETVPTGAVAAAHKAVTGDTIAKFLFTSGSTQLPKAVINTHRMLCCNQQMNTQCYPFLDERPPVMVDWLPWHHTAGGNHDFGLVLSHGGTMYIDEGKPTPDGMAETIRNLREVSPTLYYTVPKGLESLARAMRDDAALRESFFRDLRLIFPAGAALPRPVQDAIDEMAVQTVGQRIPMNSGLGMTETAPIAFSAHLADWQAGSIGLPAPGVEAKLVPSGDKFELRYRGPNVTPGYWRQPELATEAFDEEGYFRSGDAARFVDEAAPEKGLRFDGRIAEDFKLASGTWVNVGALRMTAIAAGAPYVHDVVLTGHDRDELGMLVFLLPSATRLAEGLTAGTPLPVVASHGEVRAWAQRLLDDLAAKGTGGSNRIVRALLLEEPPSIDAGEITDKGSINQRAVLKRRADQVEALYADRPLSSVLVAGQVEKGRP